MICESKASFCVRCISGSDARKLHSFFDFTSNSALAFQSVPTIENEASPFAPMKLNRTFAAAL